MRRARSYFTFGDGQGSKKNTMEPPRGRQCRMRSLFICLHLCSRLEGDAAKQTLLQYAALYNERSRQGRACRRNEFSPHKKVPRFFTRLFPPSNLDPYRGISGGAWTHAHTCKITRRATDTQAPPHSYTHAHTSGSQGFLTNTNTHICSQSLCIANGR